MEKALQQEVRRRARDCCEYCRISAALVIEPFQFDHIIARKHGGPTAMGNLACCCGHCNRHKGTDLSGLDPLTNQIVPLFHPRNDHWREHFALAGAVIVGLTATGRVTVAVLRMNAPTLLGLRALLIDEGAYTVDES